MRNTKSIKSGGAKRIKSTSEDFTLTLTLKDLAKIFFKLGVTGFGGPLAVVEQLRVIFVQELQVMSNQEFNQVFTIMKAMPGPIAFQYSVYFGKRFGGYPGACVAGLGLVLPASLIMICYAIFYDQIIEFQEMKNFMLGVQYAVAGVIAFTVFSLAKPTMTNWKFLALVPLCAAKFLCRWRFDGKAFNVLLQSS